MMGRWLWIVPPFLILGLAAAIGISAIADRFGILLAILGLVAAPLILFAFFNGLKKGVKSLVELAGHLRWWHWLWLLAFASGLVFRVRGVGDIRENPVDAWAAYRIGLEIIVAAVLIVRLAIRRTPWFGSTFRGLVGALAALGMVGIASTAWSVYPSWTFYKSFEFLLDVSLLAAILVTVQSAKSYKHFFDWTWTLYGLLLVSVWVGVILWPNDALYGQGFPIGILGVRLTGVLPAVSANDVGTYAALLGLVSLTRLLPIAGERSKRSWYFLLLAASIVTMILAQTRTAIAGFLFGLFLLLWFSRRLGLSAVMTFFVGPLLVLSSMGGIVWEFLQRGENEQQLQTFSSRLIWWSFAWDKFLERPLTGFGAYAAGRFAVLSNLGLSVTSTMHSDYLEIIVGTGFWGMVSFLAALAGTWWFLYRYLRRSRDLGIEQQLAYEALVVLGLLTFRSIFMTMLSWHPALHYFVIVGYAEYLRRAHIKEAAVRARSRQVPPKAIMAETFST